MRGGKAKATPSAPRWAVANDVIPSSSKQAPFTPRPAVASSSKHTLDDSDDDIIIIDSLPPPSAKRTRLTPNTKDQPVYVDVDMDDSSYTETLGADDEVMLVDGVMEYTPRRNRRKPAPKRDKGTVTLTGLWDSDSDQDRPAHWPKAPKIADSDDEITIIGSKPAPRRSQGTTANPIVLGGEDDLVDYKLVHPNAVKLPIDGFPHIVLEILLNAPPKATGVIAGINRWFLEQMDKQHPEHYTLTDCGGGSVTLRATCGRYLGVKRKPQLCKFSTDTTAHPVHNLWGAAPQTFHSGLQNTTYGVLQQVAPQVQQMSHQVQHIGQLAQQLHQMTHPLQPAAPPTPAQQQTQQRDVDRGGTEETMRPEDTQCRVLEFQRYPQQIQDVLFLSRLPAKVMRVNIAMAGHTTILPWTDGSGRPHPNMWRNLSMFTMFGDAPAKLGINLPLEVKEVIFNIEVNRSGTFSLATIRNMRDYLPSHFVYVFKRGTAKCRTSLLVEHIAAHTRDTRNHLAFTIVNFPGSQRLVDTGNERGRHLHEDAFRRTVYELFRNTAAARFNQTPVNINFFTHAEYKRKLGPREYAERTEPISMASWEKPVRSPRRPRLRL